MEDAIYSDVITLPDGRIAVAHERYDASGQLVGKEYIPQPALQNPATATPICKATMFPDSVAAALGLPPTASVAEGLSKLAPAGLHVETGTYKGTGTVGPIDNATKITFSRKPKVVFITATSTERAGYSPFFVWIEGNSFGWNGRFSGSNSGSYTMFANVLFNGNTMNIYSFGSYPSDSYQMNMGNVQYLYYGIS